MNRRVLSFFAFALAAGACGSSTQDGANESFTPPAGCTRTYCDADFDQCKDLYSSSDDACSKCWSLCGPDNAVSCSDSCNSICSNDSSTRTDPCDRYRDTCRNSADNRVCIDGVDPTDLPVTVAESKWHQPWEREARCTDAEINRTLDAIEKGTWTFDKEAPYGSCARCIAVNYDVSDPWAALVVSGDELWVNRGGCIALVDGDVSKTSIGASISNHDECLAKACGRASDSAACRAIADQTACKAYVSAAQAAEEVVANDRAYDVCGGADEEFLSRAYKVISYFCAGK